jgi:5-methylcytosine-specific restriction protein A
LDLAQEVMMSGPRLIILKTDSGNIEGVRKHAKHATDVPPRHLEPGDLILIQVTVLSSNNPAPVIRYVMEYVRCYEDRSDESGRIWGRHWRYIVEGARLKNLLRPFDIRTYQVSKVSYGRGAIKYVYVRPEDAAILRQRGLLETV